MSGRGKVFDEEVGVLVFVLSRQLRRRVRNNLFARLMQITQKMANGVMSRGDNRDTLANAPMVDASDYYKVSTTRGSGWRASESILKLG